MDFSQVVYALCYGAIAVAVWRANAPFPLLLGFCLLEIPYSFAAARLVPAVDLAMMILGAVVCMEAALHALRNERLWPPAAAMALSTIAAIAVETGLQDTALTPRHIIIVSLACSLGTLVLLDWVRPFECGRVVRLNLRLRAASMFILMADTLAYTFYAKEKAWVIAEWIYLAQLAAIAACYVFLLSGRGERRAWAFRDRPRLLPRH